MTKISFSQDSVAYGRDFVLFEGLYLQYSDFRHNWPIPKEKIVTDINKDQLDFYIKLIENDDIEYIERDGKKAKIKAERVWGFCQNNVIYINFRKDFYRIPVFGAISHFVAYVDMPYNPFLNAPVSSQPGTTKELREFLLDFYTGELHEASVEKVEELLKRDEVIYKEYMSLSKKKKKEQATRFIRKYNELHPVYFPKF